MSRAMTAATTNGRLGIVHAGVVAGPLFVATAIVQAFTRDGFDPVRHPASMLSLGDLGWIQIANFVLAGLLFILCGLGLRRTLATGIGRTWAPRLFVLYGVALVMGGVFTADAGLGFPPGAPAGAPAQMSWHGMIHAIAPILGFVANTAALIVLAQRFGSQGNRAWQTATLVIAIVSFVLAAVPNFTADWERGVFNFLPLWASVCLGLIWTSIVIARVAQDR